jgi:hypothetical protein
MEFKIKYIKEEIFMINIDEQTRMIGRVVVNHEDKAINIANISANLSSLGNSFSLNVNILDKELVELYKAEVDAQINSFYDALKQKQLEIGYSIVIR